MISPSQRQLDLWLWYPLVAVGLTALGVLAISAPSPAEARRNIQCGHCDVESYVAMTEGHWAMHPRDPAPVPSPFRYRVFVPWLARHLPLTSSAALRAISFGALSVSYVFILLASRRLGVSSAAGIAALATAFCAYSQLWLYTNPYLVDGFAQLVLAVMVYALVADVGWLFVVAAIVGVLTRETTLVLVPIWCARDVRRGLAFIARRSRCTSAIGGWWVQRRVCWPEARWLRL